MNRHEHEELKPLTAEEMEEVKRGRNEYYRKWRKEHPESVKRSAERYWRKRLEMSKSTMPNGERVETR